MPPTPYAELNKLLATLVESVARALGETLVGAYLQGSFATGGFDRHSDVDFVMVTDGELSETQLESLQDVHARAYELPSDWAKHLEGSYFPREVLRDRTQSSTELWYLEHGDRKLQRSPHCNTLVVRRVLRRHGVALFGPPAAELLDPVPEEELRMEIATTMREWGCEILNEPEAFANHFYQGFIVLSYCRMLRDIEVGDIGSKREGAEWASRELGNEWRTLIERAWDARPDPAASVRRPADPREFGRTLEFVRYCLEVGARRYPGSAQDDAGKLAAGMVRYYEERAPWHDCYMSYSGNEAMEELLRPIVERLGEHVAGRDVLEVACGTGNWTQVLSKRAASVLATDASPEALAIARGKRYGPGRVEFRVADAYRLEGIPAGFTCAFAGDWWSHVPRTMLRRFLDGLHQHLEPGSRVAFVEIMPRDHPDLIPYRYDRDGNGICRRVLPSGAGFDVVRNYHTREEILEAIGKRGRAARYHEWPELGRWLLTYEMSPARS